MRSSLLGLLLWSSLGAPGTPSGFWSPVVPPRAHYQVECTFDIAATQMKGTETISFRNNTSRPMERLALGWNIGPRMSVTALANGKPATLLLSPDQKEAHAPLLLQLPEALKPGQELELKLEFSSSGFNKERGVLLGNWNPRLWWGFGTLDDYDVRIHVPPGWAVVTSGVRDPATGVWNGKDIREFAVAIFDEKQYSIEQVLAGDVQITVVHTAAGAKCAQLVLQTAVDAIGFYRNRFGFYPHRSLTLVPGMDYPAGGYPVATAMVVIHGEEQMEKKPEAHFRWITAHEIGHMYWSRYVLAEGEDPLDWLMIGLGIFADREYRRAREIPQTTGNLPVDYINGMKDGIDTTMDLTDEQQEVIDWDFNNVVEHGKSSAMMDALEATVGAAAFERAYRRSLREFHGRRMGWRDFKKVCEEESGEDLGWFFQSWVRTNQYASYQIARRESVQTAGGWRTHVEVVSQGTRRERVPVVVTFADGSQQTQYTDRLATASLLIFESKSPLKEVKFDPSNTLWMLDSEPPLSTADVERKIIRLNLTGSAEEARTLLPRARELRLPASRPWWRLGLMLYDGKYYAEALDCFQKALDTTADKDYRFMALVWQGLLLDLMGRRDAAVQAYKAAQATGSELTLRFDQYKLKIDQKWVRERLETPFQRD